MVLFSDADPTVIETWLDEHFCYVERDSRFRMLKKSHPRPVYHGQDDHDAFEFLQALGTFFDSANPMTLRCALKYYPSGDA